MGEQYCDSRLNRVMSRGEKLKLTSNTENKNHLGYVVSDERVLKDMMGNYYQENLLVE